MKFRLMKGTHEQDHPTAKLPTGKPASQRFFWKDPKNCIVESDIDLEARFGRPKFQRVTDSMAEEIMNSNPSELSGEAEEDSLDEMSLNDLRTHAGEEEIDLTGCKTKQDVIKAIRAASQLA